MDEDNSDSSFDSSDSAYDSEPDAEGEAEEDEDQWGGVVDNESGESKYGPEMGEDKPPPPKKKLGFKDWAQKQLSLAKTYVPPPIDDPLPNVQTEQAVEPPRKKVKRDPMKPPEMRGPLGRDLPLPATPFGQHIMNQGLTKSSIKYVEIKRPEDVEAARILLPIVTEEQPIMEAIMLNPILIICGETGSGKTTQVPQFLYEAGFGTPGSGRSTLFCATLYLNFLYQQTTLA